MSFHPGELQTQPWYRIRVSTEWVWPTFDTGLSSTVMLTVAEVLQGHLPIQIHRPRQRVDVCVSKHTKARSSKGVRAQGCEGAGVQHPPQSSKDAKSLLTLLPIVKSGRGVPIMMVPMARGGGYVAGLFHVPFL
eukprot:gene9753-biopygen4299